MGATNCLFSDDSVGNDEIYKFDSNGGRDLCAHLDDGTEKFAIMGDGFMRTTSGYKNRYISIGFGDIAADSDVFTYPVFVAKHDITIIEAFITVDTDITDDNTNYQTIALKQTGTSTAIVSKTSDITWSQHVQVDMGSVDSAAAKVKAGASINVTFTKTASGKAMSGFVIAIRFTIDQPKDTPGTATDNLFRFRNEIGSEAVIGADVADDRDFLLIQNNGVDQLRIDVNGMVHGESPDRYQYDVINMGDIATGDSKKAPILRCDVKTRIEKIWVGVDTTITVNSNANHWQLKLTDATNTIADFYLRGPFGNAVDMTKGVFYDVGKVNQANNEIAASGVLQVEPVEVGTGPAISSLTIVVAYRKMA